MSTFIMFLKVMVCESACRFAHEPLFVYVLCASVCARLSLVSPMSGFTSLTKGIFFSLFALRTELLSVRSAHAKCRIKCP